MLPKVVSRCIRLHKAAGSEPLAAATPELPLPKDEKLHAGVPFPVIACMVRRAPLRSQAPQTLLASIDTHRQSLQGRRNAKA